jgi:hypothetical protein
MHILKQDIEFSQVGTALICGNVGIKRGTLFEQYWEGNIRIDIPIDCVTGKYEDFGWVKEIQGRLNSDYEYPHLSIIDSLTMHVATKNLITWSIGGCSGTYSEKYYLSDSAPMRHMAKEKLFSIDRGLDIVLLHNVPGQLGNTHDLNFHDDFFKFIEEKTPRYIFVGGYSFPKCAHFFQDKTTVVFLPIIDKGYALVDTETWHCHFNNKVK